MNYVNLIGKMSSTPKYVQLENGSKVANFTLLTLEPYLDKQGQPKVKKYWHRMFAWGNSIPKLEEFSKPGANMAVEGRLITRFYQDSAGRKRSVSEVEINDLEIIS